MPNFKALSRNFGKILHSRNWQKKECVIALPMHLTQSQGSWDPWDNVNKVLQKAIMERFSLRNKFKQNHTSENWHEYKKLRHK